MADKCQNIQVEKQIEMNNSSNDEVGIDFIGLLCRIIDIRKILYKAAGVGLVLGVIVALSVPKQYMVEVTLSPEMGGSKGNSSLAGVAASFLGSSATANEGSDALNASLSADIVSSTPFLLELLDMNITSSDKKINSLKVYMEKQSVPWWSYAIGLPGIIIGSIKSLFGDEEKETAIDTMRNTIKLSPEKANIISRLKNAIRASVDNKTAITRVSVSLQDPEVAAIVADSVVYQLQEYIINYRTSKAKDDAAYLERLFEERQQEYYILQKKYADYVDTHDDLILQSLRTEQERLQNDMNLAYQIYGQVANQLQAAKAKVQEEKPVFAVVEPAVVPLSPSGITQKVYIIIFVFLSVVCVGGWKLFGKVFFDRLKKAMENHQNIRS